MLFIDEILAGIRYDILNDCLRSDEFTGNAEMLLECVLLSSNVNISDVSRLALIDRLSYYLRVSSALECCAKVDILPALFVC